MKGFFICPACKGNGYRRIIKDNDPKGKKGHASGGRVSLSAGGLAGMLGE